MKRKIISWSVAVASVLVAGGVLLFALFWNGILLFNNPSPTEYPVRGVDVSSYQGQIDWPTLASQDLSFAFIKATEGSSYVDPCFDYNYRQARQTHLRISAYHFFSYDSSGDTQADNFIRTVEPVENMLPPVVDLEFYGDKEANPPPREAVNQQLDLLLTRLEEHYGMRPILYATEKSYSLYLAGGYEEYDIWIRNVTGTPGLSDGKSWTFWQYTNRARLEGYRGEEPYIDLNVFCGTAAEFEQYGK